MCTASHSSLMPHFSGKTATPLSIVAAGFVMLGFVIVAGCDSGSSSNSNDNDNDNDNDNSNSNSNDNSNSNQGNSNAYCGDGVIDSPELCDDGSANSDTLADACRSDCHPAYCGDEVIDASELCDDGNNTDGDGCSGTCQTEGACEVAGGICTAERWVICPVDYEPLGDDLPLDCGGHCCVPAPPSNCSSDPGYNCVLGESCEGCWYQSSNLTCETGRVCCTDICD